LRPLIFWARSERLAQLSMVVCWGTPVPNCPINYPTPSLYISLSYIHKLHVRRNGLYFRKDFLLLEHGETGSKCKVPLRSSIIGIHILIAIHPSCVLRGHDAFKSPSHSLLLALNSEIDREVGRGDAPAGAGWS
jgi:hypothetical protein